MSTYECDEERDNVDNGQCPTRLQHGACLVDVESEIIAAPVSAIVSKWTEIDVEVSGGEVGTVCVANASKLHHTSYQSAHESEINECHEERVVSGAQVADQGKEGPRQCQYRHYEQHQDEVRRELVVVDEAVYEPA